MDRTRYRYVDFKGGRILQAREMEALQDIVRGIGVDVDETHIPTAFDLAAVYKEGATFNITANLVLKTVHLQPTDSNKPMLVFVRGRWETLQSGEAPSIALAAGATPNDDQKNLYLNWHLVKRTLSDDALLVDSTTLEATADMGELTLEVSATDTHGPANPDTEFERNTAAIVLLSFVHTSNSLTQDTKDNVNPQALASVQTAGLVKTTTPTPIVVSTDDARMDDARTPSDVSVTDAKVRTPVRQGVGTNLDGTPVYDISPQTDAGGISSAKIVHRPGTQLLSDAVENLKAEAVALDARLDTHEGAHLGQNTTHPFPTAQETGATPVAHQSLGLEAAHGLAASKNAGGFSVTRDKAVAPPTGENAGAFRVKDQDGLLAMLTHDGDVFSKKANILQAMANAAGDGPLGLMSAIATALAAHINKTSHENPHGLALEDLGYVSPDPDNPIDMDAWLAAAKTYTNQKVAELKDYVDLQNHIGVSWAETNIGWMVVSFGTTPRVELAFGVGAIQHGAFLVPPTGFNNCFATASVGQYDCEYDEDNPAHVRAYMIGMQVVAQEWSSKKGMHYGNANVSAVAWRLL
jgi:hypothetical protein